VVKDLAANDSKKKLSSFYKSLFENTDTNKAGAAVLVDLFGFCGMDRSSFCPGDPYSTAFNEGARRVFLRIMGMIRMDAKDIEELMKKMKEKERERFEW
jgi:hypothetical protein